MGKYTSFREYINPENHKVTDLHNPKCKNCNECCGLLTMLTEEEYQSLKHFLTKTSRGRNLYQKGIDLICRHFDMGTMYFQCPLSNDYKRCEIYSMRPGVCRDFHCSPELNKVVNDKLPETHNHYLWELFYTKSLQPYRMIID